MARLRLDFAGGLLGQDLQPGDTVAVSPAFASLPPIAAPDYMPVTLDPGGTPEISYIVAHALSSASVTLTRAAEQGASNPAILHTAGKSWVQGPTVEDFDGRLRVATSTTLPSAPDDGMTFALADTLEIVTWLAGAWQTVGGVPIGVISAYAGAVAAGGTITPPQGWLFCNGQAVTPTAYPALYTLLHGAGNPYGVDGSSNPLVPDLRDKRVAGAGGEYATGTVGGHDTYTLGESDMWNHTHPISDPTHGHTVTDPQHYHAGIHVTGLSGGSNGWMSCADSASVEGTTGSGISTRATYANPAGVITGSAKTGVTVVSHSTGITGTQGMAGAGAQTALDMRAPYLAAPFIIKAT